MFHVYLQGILSKTDDPAPELPAPTITSVIGGIDSLIVNGTTNVVSVPEPDPELPAPTITSVIGGIDSLIVNGTTNIVSVPEPPSVPSNFRTVETTTSSVTLAWNSVSNADFYEVFRGGSLLTQTSGLGYQDTNLSENTTYSYTIRAFNDGGYSNFSSTLTVTTLEEDTPPEPGDWPLYTEPLNTPLSWTPINEVSMTDHAGFAGVRSIGSGNHPSSNPNDWVRFEDDSQWKTLDFVHPKMGLPSRNEYPHFWKVQGGVGTLYGGAYDTQSSDRTSVLGMVSRSRIIGEEWRHNHNDRRRAIYKYLPWANNSRRMNPTLHYDPINKTYVSFFGERIISEPWYGFRCISSAWSPTPHLADSWQYKEDRPLLTHDIVQDIYPDLMEPQYPGNDYDRFARMYPKYSFFHEGKHHLYFEAVIWCTSTGNSETIDFCLATEDYTDHTAWERVDFDYTNIRAERRPHGEGGTGSFWNRRGHRWLHEMTYYDGWYYGVSHASNGTFERGPALYRSRSPLGPFEVYGQADVPLIVSPYGNRNGKGNLILYRDVWFLFCSIRDTTDEQNTPLWDKYAGANVDGDMRVIWGGYYDPLNKINDILNSG